MVKNLYLVRHSVAESEAGSDFDRQLTGEGQRIARHLGRWLSEQKVEVDKVYSSAAPRALSTADLMTESWGVSGLVETVDDLYEASVRSFLQTICNTDSALSNVIFVGHNPTVTYLAEFISGSTVDNMHPGSLVHIQLKGVDWAEVGEKTGDLVRHLSPSEIS